MDSLWQGLPSLSPALAVDGDDPEAARARGAIAARILGEPLTPARIGRFIVLERLGAGGMGIVYAAFDPRLDRKVAIKLLFERDGETPERDRLVSEAKAMAKLAHPHVVHVYEVGEHRGRLFVAMEYVRGRTLRRWLAERPRGVRETLAMCVQAGQGLAAAHAAGIVHRDFKPDNVLVGDDGRARVLDFGLARTVYERTVPDECSSPDATEELPTARTRTGTLLGTPGYMAPEQLCGEPADGRSDQFSFCVTVWEALVGALPFAGRTVDELRGSVLAGRIQPPPRGKLSGRIERVLRRGLAVEGRWATLAELLHALSRDPSTALQRRVGLAAAAVGIAGAFAMGGALQDAPVAEDRCGGAESALQSAWPAAQRSEDLARIASLGGEYGDALARRLTTDVEGFGERWIATHRDACQAHRRGEQSDDLLDRRMTCLHRGRTALATLGQVAGDVDRDGLPALAFASRSLPEPSDCSDLARLSAVTQPLSADGKALAARVQEAQVLFKAGRIDDVLARVPQLVADARAVGHDALLAEAVYLQAVSMIERGDRTGAAVHLREATQLALASGADEIAILAWSNRAWAHGTGDQSADPDALEGRELMTALVERHLDTTAAISFYANLGGAEIGLGHRDRARESFRRGVEIGERFGTGAGRQRVQVITGLALVSDDPAARERLLAHAVALLSETAGAEHPRTLSARIVQGMSLEDPARGGAIVTAACEDMRALHPNERDNLASCEKEIAAFADELGDPARALAANERWLELADDAEQLDLAKATVARMRGEPKTSVAIASALIARYEALPSAEIPFYVVMERGEAELELGRAWQALRDPRADAMLRRALASFEQAASVQPIPRLKRRIAFARRLVTATPLSAEEER